MSAPAPNQTVKTSNDVHNLHQCVINSFNTSTEYLNHCCSTSTQPYVSDYVKKRCDELHAIEPTSDLSPKN